MFRVILILMTTILLGLSSALSYAVATDKNQPTGKYDGQVTKENKGKQHDPNNSVPSMVDSTTVDSFGLGVVDPSS